MSHTTINLQKMTQPIEIKESLIEQALVKFSNKDARYLINADVEKLNNNEFIINADFSIGRSCYISPGSGHFNATESLICFSQMFFVGIFAIINSQSSDLFQELSIDSFDKNRHNVHIFEISEMKFKKEIKPEYFHGLLKLIKKKVMFDKIYFECLLSYGNSMGESSQYGTLKVSMPRI